MSTNKTLKNALISVYHKEGLEPIVKQLVHFGVNIYSTGGTQSYLEGLGATVLPVEELTGYPSILGGRVKTLHPKIIWWNSWKTGASG
jgi:phosphoribosylaminoimidazolecarboxamide formyltransferase/IMP cyclohydrolase